MTKAAARPKSEADVARLARRVQRFARFGYWLLPILALTLVAVGLPVMLLMMLKTNAFAATTVALLIVAPAMQIFVALWFKVPPPEGTKVTAEDAPDLFRIIDEARATLKTPPVHAVYLTNDFNASACERPRRGLFGGWEQNLIIGLPLMCALSPKELKGVIGHELGHFAGSHGRRHVTVTRTFVAWGRTIEMLETMWFPFVVSRIVHALGRWYLPRLSLLSQQLSRWDEFEADRAEASVVGARTAAEAHARIAIAAAFLSDNMRKFYEANLTGARPKEMPTAMAARILPAASGWPGARKALTEALAEKTEEHDSHPALSERIAALGSAARVPWPLKDDASQLLGTTLRARLIAASDAAWWDDASEDWTKDGPRKGKLARLEALAAEHCAPLPLAA